MHGRLPNTKNWESTDAVIIAGDIAPNYTSHWLNDWDRQLNWFKDEFCSWAKSIPAGMIIFITGNHDGMGHKHHEIEKIIQDFRYVFPQMWPGPEIHKIVNLNNLTMNLGGFKLAGSPYSCAENRVIFSNDGSIRWAHYASEESLDLFYNNLNPSASSPVDILVSHTPPFGILDETFGSKSLLKHLQNSKIQLVICGHAHRAAGIQKISFGPRAVTIINAAERNMVVEIYRDVLGIRHDLISNTPLLSGG